MLGYAPRSTNSIPMPRFDVTIAGELNLDLILYGLPEQLPPERELLADRMMLTLGSSSAIVAHNLAALGSRVGFQSRIGDDPLGTNRTRSPAARRSRRVARAARSGATTTGLTVILHHGAWRNILTYRERLRKLLGGSRPRLPRRLPSLSFFVLLFAARVASAGGRAISNAEIEGPHDFSRHQR